MCVLHPPVPHRCGPTTWTIASGVPSPFRSNQLRKYLASTSSSENILRDSATTSEYILRSSATRRGSDRVCAVALTQPVDRASRISAAGQSLRARQVFIKIIIPHHCIGSLPKRHTRKRAPAVFRPCRPAFFLPCRGAILRPSRGRLPQCRASGPAGRADFSRSPVLAFHPAAGCLPVCSELTYFPLFTQADGSGPEDYLDALVLLVPENLIAVWGILQCEAVGDDE